MQPRRVLKRGEHYAALHMISVEHIEMSVHGDDLMALAADLGMKHVDKLLTGKWTAKKPGTLGVQEGYVSELQLLNRSIRCGPDD